MFASFAKAPAARQGAPAQGPLKRKWLASRGQERKPVPRDLRVSLHFGNQQEARVIVPAMVTPTGDLPALIDAACHLQLPARIQGNEIVEIAKSRFVVPQKRLALIRICPEGSHHYATSIHPAWLARPALRQFHLRRNAVAIKPAAIRKGIDNHVAALINRRCSAVGIRRPDHAQTSLLCPYKSLVASLLVIGLAHHLSMIVETRSTPATACA